MTSPPKPPPHAHPHNGTTDSERSPLLPKKTILNGTTAVVGERQPPGSVEDALPAPPPNGYVDDVEEEDGEGKGVSRLRGTLIGCALGSLILIQTINISMLTTTQSAIATDLNAYEDTSWFASAYLVGMSSFSPLAGRLSEIFSPRWIIFSATLIFCIGSIITAPAASLAVFLVGRAISGVAAAGIFTTSILIVLDLVGPKRRGLFVGLVNSGYTVGIAIGAALGGWLEPQVGWRMLYWLQAPVALAAGLGLLLSIKPPAEGARKTTVSEKLQRIDYLGAVTVTSSLLLICIGLSASTIRPTPIILALLILPVFVLHEARLASEPIIPVTLLRSRGMLLSCIATVGSMTARWAVLFYSPVYALAVRGWAPGTAGTILIPTNAGFALGGLLSGWLHIRRSGSFYIPTILTYTLFPLTLLTLSFLATTSSPMPLFIFIIFLNGLAAGAQLNYTLAHVLHLTPMKTHFVASSLLVTFRGFAGTFGSAVGGGVFVRYLRPALEEGFGGIDDGGNGDGSSGLDPRRKELVRRLLGSPALVGDLEGVERVVAVQAYERAVRGLWLVGVAVAVGVLFVQACVGWKGPGEKGVGGVVGGEDEEDYGDGDGDGEEEVEGERGQVR